MFKKLAIAALLALMPTAAWAVAETLTSTRADSGFPVFKPQGSGTVGFAYGVYEVPAAVEDGDIWQMAKIPAGACIIDGFVRADDMDTGTEALDMDIGWAANGAETADPDGLGNLGVWTGDAVVGVKPEVMNAYRANGVLKDGPVCFTQETVIQVEANAAANAGHVGTMWMGVYYIAP